MYGSEVNAVEGDPDAINLFHENYIADVVGTMLLAILVIVPVLHIKSCNRRNKSLSSNKSLLDLHMRATWSNISCPEHDIKLLWEMSEKSPTWWSWIWWDLDIKLGVKIKVLSRNVEK